MATISCHCFQVIPDALARGANASFEEASRSLSKAVGLLRLNS